MKITIKGLPETYVNYWNGLQDILPGPYETCRISDNKLYIYEYFNMHLLPPLLHPCQLFCSKKVLQRSQKRVYKNKRSNRMTTHLSPFLPDVLCLCLLETIYPKPPWFILIGIYEDKYPKSDKTKKLKKKK